MTNNTEEVLVEKNVDESGTVHGENSKSGTKKKQTQSTLASFFSKAKWMGMQHLQIFYVHCFKIFSTFNSIPMKKYVECDVLWMLLCEQMSGVFSLRSIISISTIIVARDFTVLKWMSGRVHSLCALLEYCMFAVECPGGNFVFFSVYQNHVACDFGMYIACDGRM